MRESLRAAPDLARNLAALEKELTGRLDVHEAAIVGVLQELMKILNPPLDYLRHRRKRSALSRSLCPPHRRPPFTLPGDVGEAFTS